MNTDLLLSAIAQHQWAVVTGCVLLLVVYAAKLPPVAVQWVRLPAWSRPLVPVALGILAGVAEALTTQRSWVAALITQVVAALPALAVALPSPVMQLVAPAPTPQPSPSVVIRDVDRDTDRIPPPGG